MGLDPAQDIEKIQKTKSLLDKIKALLDFSENVEEGKQQMKEYNLTRCKSEKEIQDRIKKAEEENGEGALEAEHQKAAAAAKQVSDAMAGPVSYIFENTINDKVSIGNAAKAYGMITAPAKDCTVLLNGASP